MKTNPVELQWIEDIKADNYVSYNRLFMEYYDKLRLFVESIVADHDSAKDIVQEVFIKLWTDRKTIMLQTTLFGYLIQMAKNKALNFVRDEKNRRILLKEKMDEDNAFWYRCRPESAGFSEVLEECLRHLSVRSREILLMYYVDGYKQKEIAEKLGISVQTVKNQMCISIKRLKAYLKNRKV
jgi:RNA polymerase sigma-70 factor (ECF subfamily)